MTLKRGFQFEFEIPSGWRDDSDSPRRIVVHGPHDEELIVSGAVVAERAPGATGRQDQVRTLFDRTVLVAKSVLEKQGLQKVDEHQPDWDAELPVYRLSALSPDAKVAFLQAVAQGTAGVLYMTLESPIDQDPQASFSRFISSVRTVSFTA